MYHIKSDVGPAGHIIVNKCSIEAMSCNTGFPQDEFIMLGSSCAEENGVIGSLVKLLQLCRLWISPEGRCQSVVWMDEVVAENSA